MGIGATIRNVAEVPATAYARSGEITIAYQVLGHGPDLVVIPGFSNNLEFFWEEPHLASYIRRLASFARLILFDPRGMGLSDRLAGVRTLEERMDDLRAVMAAVGSDRAAIWAQAEAGAMSILFAATYPERTTALILYGSFARLLCAPDYPYGPTDQAFERVCARVEQSWGQGLIYGSFFPDKMAAPRWMRYFARFERQSATPTVAAANLRMMASIDVRGLLPSLRVPTLLLHQTHHPSIDVNHSRYRASVIPDARLIELPGHGVGGYYDDDCEEPELVEEFLTGHRSPREADRVLATVLFTDIVASTETAARLGDHDWRDLLHQHDAVLSELVRQHRGQVIKSTGDGLLATFDGPARAVRCATDASHAVRELGIEIRAGLHTGEIEPTGNDIAGIAVHIAARVASHAANNQILVSRTIVDLVAGSNITFRDHGEHELKGIPGPWHLYAVDALH
ncbi:MAG: adenylate/guanylate cyclase domain-containing protein [Acidimicrobiales bacterium]